MSDINFNEFEYNHGYLFLLSDNQFLQPTTGFTITHNRDNSIARVMRHRSGGRPRTFNWYTKQNANGTRWIGNDRNLLNAVGTQQGVMQTNNTAVQWFLRPRN